MRSTHLSSPLSRILFLTRRYLTTRLNYASILLPVAPPTEKKSKPRLNIDSQNCIELNDWSLIGMTSLFYNLSYKSLTFMLGLSKISILPFHVIGLEIFVDAVAYIFFLSTNLKICILGQMTSKVQAQELFRFKEALRI